MTNTEHLVERHIKEYEARLKHIDELMKSADDALSGNAATSELHEELDILKQEREQMHTELDVLRERSAIAWSKKGGPMVMWDVMAGRLESLLEKVQHWTVKH